MRARIGFVVINHQKPDQLLLLLRRLTVLYHNPPIVVHHDHTQASLAGYHFPRSVSFVNPHIVTRWAHISCVKAFLAALRQLYSTDSPDWFVQLSSTDYPVRPADYVLEELESGGFDAYLDHRLVEYPYSPDAAAMSVPYAFKSARWVPTAYKRYVAIPLWLPWFSWRKRKLLRVNVLSISSPAIVRLGSPFTDRFQCYGGECWFTGNRKVANILLEDSSRNRELLAHLGKRIAPDEAFVHTILCNRPDLKISNDNKRYVDWSRGGHHPKILEAGDLPLIMKSGAHFARKFALQPELYAAIDNIVDRKSFAGQV